MVQTYVSMAGTTPHSVAHLPSSQGRLDRLVTIMMVLIMVTMVMVTMVMVLMVTMIMVTMIMVMKTTTMMIGPGCSD